MQAIEIKSFDADCSGLAVRDVPEPRPARGQVLVRVSCAPVNPIDLMTISGTYPTLPALPFLAGITAVGEVVHHNAGLMGRILAGKRVVFATPEGTGGAWAQMAVTTTDLCVPLTKKLADEDAVNLISNATTTIGLIDTLKKNGHRAAIITAAASEVGRMMNMEARRAGLTLINVVRRAEQVDVLRALGATHCLDMSKPSFDDDLRKLASALNAKAALDSISGTMPERLMSAMPPGSTIWVIGRLSEAPISFDGLDQLSTQRHVVRGFSIYHWLTDKSMLGKVRAVLAGRSLLQRQKYRTQIARRMSLDEVANGLGDAWYGASGGKLLIYPNGVPS